VPRASIHWNPTIIEEACIGCGTCVTGYSRLVYRYVFERKKLVVIDPLNCMVGCTTCANTCLARRDMLESPLTIPHPDCIITLRVSAIDRGTADVIRVTLTPAGDAG
ncbi:MAG: hypothetical protein WD005_06630, partial [Haliea sp.]